MQDLQTESLWSHVTGECLMGPMEGARLAQFPAMHTTYQQFTKIFPEGVLLKKPEKGEEGSPYDSYFEDPDKLGIFGTENKNEALKGKDKVFGLQIDDIHFAVAESYLNKNNFAVIPYVAPPVIVTYDKIGKTAAAFALPDRSSDDIKTLKVENNEIRLTDRKIVWNAQTGKIMSGKAKDLKRVPVVTAYWFAWANFFPETELIK